MRPEIERRLEAKGIKATAMRYLVLDCLLRQRSAISLADVEKALAPADRTTIYRTLKTFEDHCLVHAIDDGSGASRYALCDEDCNDYPMHDLHVHFYCNACKNTTCLPDTRIPAVELPHGFHAEETKLVIKGVCVGCSS